ncbi:MAG: GTPase ObgE [Bacteroidales bacterium]|nr:GTPase ObgE [Bacteroidales bacterium]
MSNENFIDSIRVFLRSGRGGDGCVHFYRDKFTRKGGPDGGDGGNGGNIIIKGNRNLWTLLHLRYKKHFFAGNGKNGSKNNCNGANGKDVIIELPLGTIAKDEASGKILGEVTYHDQEIVILRGGKGGKGNAFFKSPTNQAPRYAQKGEEGKEITVIFELKLLADVGIIGFPNAGKSTLLATITAAKPKIADYPFTTLVPNVGIVKVNEIYSFVISDMPGIIEGAHLGKGLGHRFLRHIERNSILLFLIPVTSENIFKEYLILLHELEMYNKELLNKKRIIGISKADLLSQNEIKELENVLSKKLKEPFVVFSSVSGYNVNSLINKLWQLLNEN